MANWTTEIATEFNFPNITIYRLLKDGVHSGYRAITNDGYVMYDTTANNTETDPETLEERPVTYYYTRVEIPMNFNFANFPYVAVLRSSVDENYIFGGGNNDKKENEKENIEEIEAVISPSDTEEEESEVDLE